MSKSNISYASVCSFNDDYSVQLGQHIDRCRKTRQRMLSRLQSLAKADKRKAKQFARRYMHSSEVMIAGTYDAWRRLTPEAANDQPIPYVEIIQAALTLDMWSASDEPVFLRAKERLNNLKRYFPVLQLREKARDMIAYDVAKVLVELHPNQFLTRGPAHLHAWLEEHLPNGAAVITTDIPNCYGTIKRSSVMRDVPLPGHVMKAGRSATPFGFAAGDDERRFATGQQLAEYLMERIIVRHRCDFIQAVNNKSDICWE